MLKRLFDVCVSAFGLLVFTPVLLPVMFLVWRQDGASPFYVANRVGKGGKEFRMVKLRSMVKDADKTGVDSTSADDVRITSVGHFIRRYKLDELTQLWNVLSGDMSLVGPRPNVKRETDLYTAEEQRLLSVKPGITDIASIVFSDEGDILKGQTDPDIAYHQLIRPGKSKLGLFYVEKRGFFLDIWLILQTIVAIISKSSALQHLTKKLRRLNADSELIQLASRGKPLVPTPPPGAKNIVVSRDGAVI
jgi:lipopolysaccharide/colanic/teichoic acid biosynthesis glycosyltransferase